MRYVRVIKIIDADREAGWSTQEKPPNRLIGCVGVVTRPLINWNGYWVEFLIKNKNSKLEKVKYVLDNSEITEATYEEIQKVDKGYSEIDAEKVAVKL